MNRSAPLPYRYYVNHPSRLTPSIPTHPSSASFRSLGLHLSIDLNPTHMTHRLQSNINYICARIRYHRLNLLQAAATIKETLYPSLEIGLTYTHIPKSTFNRWNHTIRTSIKFTTGGAHIKSLNNDALYFSLNLLPLHTHQLLLQLTETLRCLRQHHPQPVASSTHHRIFQTTLHKPTLHPPTENQSHNSHSIQPTAIPRPQQRLYRHLHALHQGYTHGLRYFLQPNSNPIHSTPPLPHHPPPYINLPYTIPLPPTQTFVDYPTPTHLKSTTNSGINITKFNPNDHVSILLHPT